MEQSCLINSAAKSTKGPFGSFRTVNISAEDHTIAHLRLNVALNDDLVLLCSPSSAQEYKAEESER